jgi:hypothetical protein
VDGNDIGPRVLPNYGFELRASGLQDLLSHGLDELPALEAVGESLLRRCEHAEAADDEGRWRTAPLNP